MSEGKEIKKINKEKTENYKTEPGVIFKFIFKTVT